MILKMCKGRNGARREINRWAVNILVDVNEMKRKGLECKPGIVFPVHTRAEGRAWFYSSNTARLSSVLCDKLQFSVRVTLGLAY